MFVGVQADCLGSIADDDVFFAEDGRGLRADCLDCLPLVLGARLRNPSWKLHAEIVGKGLRRWLVQRAKCV